MRLNRNDKVLALALLLFLFSVYLLTYSGTLHSSDGQAMFSVAESWVRRGEYDINQIRWMGLQQGTFGPDGNLYCRKGLGTSLVAVPLAWLGLIVPAWGVVQTTMLLNAVITALTGMLILLYVRRLGYGQSTALVTAVVFGLGTMAWPYAKYLFSEPLSGFCLLAAAYFLLEPGSRRSDRSRWLPPLLAGVFLGLAVATRFANAVLIPIYVSVLVWHLLNRPGAVGWRGVRSNSSLLLSATWRELLALGLPLLLWVVVMAVYNYVRFGNPLTTGYLPEESFSAPWALGIVGQLLSPGRGIVFFCPVLLACLPALPNFVRRHRLQAILILLTAGCYLLLYGKWFMWHGGFAWGPRFLVPVIPLLCITLAPLIDGLRGKKRAVFWALFAVSVAVQLLGVSVHFIHQQEALLQTGLPLFDLATFFNPRYSQLWGTVAFLTPANLDFAWAQSMPAGVAIDWLSLASGLLLVALCAWAMLIVTRETPPSSAYRGYLLACLSLLIVGGTALTLARYKNDGHADYASMLRFLQASSEDSDVIIQNSPPDTAILQNHYKGRLPSYGLFEGEQPLSQDTLTVLDALSARHSRIWLIPDELPPNMSSLDLWFTDRGWSATYQSFGVQRLTLYSRP